MALINVNDPYFVRNWLNPLSMFGPPMTYLPPAGQLYGQHFGNGLLVDELDKLNKQRAEGLSEVTCNKDKYQVMLDVKHFKPEEVTVKTVDNCIVVEGMHEEKPDEHGYVYRSFKRRYVLPEDIKPESVQCLLSADGVLKLEAPRAAALEDKSKERTISIVQTGKPAEALLGKKGQGQCCRQNKNEKCCPEATQ